MSWPFRPGEHRNATPGPQPGVVVLTPERKRYFFPGGSAAVAMVLARSQLGKVMDDRLTRIEFGEQSGGVWSTTEVLKRSELPEPPTSDGVQAIYRKGE